MLDVLDYATADLFGGLGGVSLLCVIFYVLSLEVHQVVYLVLNIFAPLFIWGIVIVKLLLD